MKDFIIIKIPSHPKYLSVVRSVTSGMCELNGISAQDTEDIKLAVDEACSNVIKHAYSGNTDQSIVIRFKATKKNFEVTIDDSGKKHPETIKGRSLDDVKPGGLGVHFIRRAFGAFTFNNKKKKGNRLRLIRKLKVKNGS